MLKGIAMHISLASITKWSRLMSAGLIGLLAAVFSISTYAGTENLSQVPLFLSSSADPNVMLLFDDSTSMDFQMAADVGLLTGAGSNPKYPEVDSGEPIGFSCGLNLGALITSLLQLNLVATAAQVQAITNCLAGSQVENSQPSGLLNGLVSPITGLVGAANLADFQLHLLQVPRYHYAYLNDTDDNFFAQQATNLFDGFLPVMLDEAVVAPGTTAANAESDGATNPNYRPPALPLFSCIASAQVLFVSTCVGGVSSTTPSYVPTVVSGTSGASTRYQSSCTYTAAPVAPATVGNTYSMKGDADNNASTHPSTGYWRAWNSTYNAIAYNPETKYAPWVGYDITGTPYANASATAPRLDPLYPSTTNAYNGPGTPASYNNTAYNLTQPQRQRGMISYKCNDNLFQNVGNAQIGAATLNGGEVFKPLQTDPSGTATVTSYTYTSGALIPYTTGTTTITVPTTEPVFSGVVPTPCAAACSGNSGPAAVAAWNTYATAYNVWATRWLQMYPARYYTATPNASSVYTADGPHQLVEIRPAADATCGFGATCPTTFTHTDGKRTDCVNPLSCTRAEELQNYANWFQYYRRRELTAKAAYSKVVSDRKSARMGQAVLVKNTTTKVSCAVGSCTSLAASTLNTDVAATAGSSAAYAVARMIIPMNADYTSPTCATPGNCASSNAKRDLIDHIQHVNSGDPNDVYTQFGNGTQAQNVSAITANPFGLSKPLRSGLYNVGQYFSESGSNPYGFTHDTTSTVSTNCPILNLANGGACQQNFTVGVSDGFWGANDTFTAVGNIDGSNGAGPGNVNVNCLACVDSQSNTLADIAMKYYANDLSSTLPNNEPTLPGVDEVKWQHMVTYMVAFGLSGGLSADPATRAASFTWPNPYNSDDAKIDDMRHAAYDGRGQFLTANDANGLEVALTRVFTDITARASSASSVALNSGSLNTGSTLFQARFDSSAWTGQLLAFPISSGPGASPSPCTNENVGDKCPQIWDASTVVTAQNWDTGRAILTVNGDSHAGVAFRWSNLSSSQQAWMNKNLATNTTDALGSSRLQYIRGDRFNESASNFRVRTTVLGDLINSDPFYVGAPHAPYDDMAGYSAFRASKRSRTPVVYVGANDGMLHGFRASDGHEVLAVVPGDAHIYKNLPLLPLQDYQSRHQYFVDGSAAVDDVKVGSNWKSVLVTGLRAGGQSVMAIDVTDPANFSESNADSLVLWQFSDADDADLGYTFGRPSMVKLANGKWAVLVAGGYNNNETSTQNAADAGVGGGEACLFILYMDGPTGTGKTWQSGTDYKKICVTSGGPDNSVRPNGLSSPGWVDTNGDSLADFAYAGDLEGNMWKFDLSSSSDSDWGVAYSGKALFTACKSASGSDVCTTSNRQPITTRPSIGPHPLGSPTTNGVLVYFGTGKYIEAGDDAPTGQQTQSFYMVYDQLWGAKSPASNAVATATPATVPTLPLQRSSLVQQQITSETSSSGGNCLVDSNCFRLTTSNSVTLTPVNGTPTNQGWYMDLINTGAVTPSNAGERVVSDSVLRGDRIIFTTLIPLADVCTFGGSGWLMELGFNGAALGESPYDTNGDNKVDKTDKITNGNTTTAPSGMKSPIGIVPKPTILTVSGGPGQPPEEFKYLSGSDGTIKKVTESCAAGTCPRTLTWRQIR